MSTDKYSTWCSKRLLSPGSESTMATIGIGTLHHIERESTMT